MALYHAHANYISRASTNSSCSHAAYICGEKVTDFRTNTSFDYRNKAVEVVYKNILLPQGAEQLNSTEKLWNAVEEFEDKIAEISQNLSAHFKESIELQERIKENLKKVGIDI